MTIEATIVEQLQELRRWQMQQQEELIRQQEQQREMLSNEQNRMYHALSLSVEEMSLTDESLKELIDGHKQEERESNLIDFDAPDEEGTSPEPQNKYNFSQYNRYLNKENNNNNESLKIQVPKVQLAVRNTKTDPKPNVKYNDSYNDYSSEFSDDMQSISSRSCPKQKISNISIDEIPVPSPKKDFNALLEERLKDSETVTVENKSKPVIKRPFLKKGQGLARFMPHTNIIPDKMSKNRSRPRSASFSTATHSSSSKASKTNLERCNSIPKSRKSDAPRKSISNLPSVAQQKLTLKNVPPPRRKTRNKSIGAVPNPMTPDKKKPTIIVSSDTSDLEVKNKRELEEVRIFELLEDKAENSSFCSTSSTVIAFLQQSTPLKQKALLHSASKHKISLNDIGDQTLEDIVRAAKANQLSFPQQHKNVKDQRTSQWDNVPISKLKNDKTVTGTILPYGTDVDVQYEKYNSNQELSQDENNTSLHVRFSEQNEYKTMTDTSSISSDSQTIINYINDKGAWSDCSVTPDSSDVESIISSQLKIDSKYSDKNVEFIRPYKKNQDNEREQFINYEENAEENEEGNEEGNEEENKEEYENDTEEENGTLQQKDDTIINEQNDSTSLFKSELLKTRLLELEQEIEIFRKESAALTQQRQKLQEERTKLQEERIIMQRTLKEKEETLDIEKRKTENILQEERKRLAREKAALESRMKDAWEKAQKNKQERLEIQTLRDQLEELKEEYSQKESKWSATSARQRSQMRVLQTENSKLKQELEKIKEKKNDRLKKSTTSSNTRAIHQINKFLANRKKISPFKNDEIYCEDEVKTPDNVETNYDIDLEPAEKKPDEKPIEKPKIFKTVESITRTRNLYESLLKDATDGLSEPHVGRKNLMNQQAEIMEPVVEDQVEEEEINYDVQSVPENKNISKSRSPYSPRVPEEESEVCDEDTDNQVEHRKFNNNKQGIREVHHPDGRVEYWYPNGNVKKIFPDKHLTKIVYYNGDVRETDRNGTVKYFYAATRTWHTTMPDGLEILEFPDGQVERRSKNGTIEVAFPDGSVRIVQADGSEKWALRDGTIAETSVDGEKILTLPNGQKEIHTKDHKRREYPDGTVKLVYPDGVQETRYANGRIRLKDKDGNLIMDSQ